MKQLYRYFRGEFNGAYLRALAICPNLVLQDIFDELIYQMLVQWKLEDEVTGSELPIRIEDLHNIGKIAGVFLPRLYGESSLGSIFFSPSHVVNGKQRSERGLVDMGSELFAFVREHADDYPDDIVNEASNMLRIGLVPKDAEPIGYVRHDVPIYDNAGAVIWANILPNPPGDGTPYTPYYGEKHLHFTETYVRSFSLTPALFKAYFECMQRIRYNGPTITALCDITQVIGSGYIYGLEIVHVNYYDILYYRLNGTLQIENKTGRVATWLYICAQKFKLFEPFLLEEV